MAVLRSILLVAVAARPRLVGPGWSGMASASTAAWPLSAPAS